MLGAGYRYAFVSNADNLGAVIEPAILGYLVENRLPFMMEAADRTIADRKGGHVGRLLNGQLILRESAQCPAEEMADFQDIRRHRYFNTNNLWLDLVALKDLLAARGHILGLPMIVNRKTVDPRDSASTPVYQLETAMGSAIGVFPGARAIRVPRSRFAPVKTTDDLLAVRSDAYVLTEDVPGGAESRPQTGAVGGVAGSPLLPADRLDGGAFPVWAAAPAGVRAADCERRYSLRQRCGVEGR